MSIKSEFNAHLLGHAGLVALVGNAVFPMVGGKDQTMPAVTYNFDANHERDLSNQVVLERYQVQLNVVSEVYDQANDIADQVKAALDIVNGNLNLTAIQLCQLDSESESFDDELDAYVLTLSFTLIK